MEDVLSKHPELYSYRIFLAYCYHARGERQRALDLIDSRVIATARVDQDIAYWLASLYAMDDQPREALEWLEQAISMGNENYPWLSIDPSWEKMRSDPAYNRLMENLRMKWERFSGADYPNA
jgi:hypothetical protein